MGTRLQVGDWSVEWEGDELRWTRGEQLAVQSRAGLRVSGPPAPVTRRYSQRAPLEQLMRVVFAAEPDEQAAVMCVYPWLTQATVARADAAIMALVARVRDAGGPWRAARTLLESIRGSTNMPVGDSVIDALESAVSTAELAVAFAPFVEQGFECGWLRESAEQVARELRVRPTLCQALAELHQDHVSSARALWVRARREGGDAADVAALAAASEAAASRGEHGAAFWLSCAARHVAPTAAVPLPPYRPPGVEAPDLGAREGSMVHFYSSRWTAPERPHPQQGNPLPSGRCRVCASPETETVYFCDNSGTSWRDVTHDMRCHTCGVINTYEVDD